MKFTEAARDLLKHLEGLQLKAYRDFGRGVWTIGYGHTRDVHEGDVWRLEQADAALAEDVEYFSKGVAHHLERGPQLSDERFSALVIFAFNEGLLAFAGSTALRDILIGRLDLVPAQLRRWVYAHDESGVPYVDEILKARREAEIALWLSPA